MSFEQHRGATPGGPLTVGLDRRVGELADITDLLGIGNKLGLDRDPGRATQGERSSLGFPGNFTRGVVVHAVPFVNWYKVQAGSGAGFMAACALSNGSLMPLGPRDFGMYRPNDNVLLYCPAGQNYAIILGAIPPIVQEGKVACPDWLTQGGGVGLKREKAHSFPFGNLYKAGGIIDWSGNRPIDENSAARGMITSTGIAIALTDYMLQLRVNEQCGIFMHLFDSHMRLAAMQLDIESAIHGEYVREDEGEARYIRAVHTYPWEALGLYDSGTEFTEETGDEDVHYKKHRAKVDLPEGEEDVQRVDRYVEYGGYLGQAYMRQVAKPARESGKRLYHDTDADEGLFREAIALTGAYSLLSAKSILFAKRVKIIIPRERKLVEDKLGDDAEEDNYKFSSKFGSAEEHKIKDIKIEGDLKSLRRVAAIEDLLAFGINWQTLHPFHYHKKDFLTKQESEQNDNFERVQDILDYGELASKTYMRDPEPKKLKIDHRYGQVDFFQRESFFAMHDDGSMHLGCGFGAEIVMAGGKIRLAAPGGIECLPGTDFLVAADQIMLRAKRSVDISATEHDVRIKAERNMQLLAGNEGSGGMLIESFGEGSMQDYDQKYGEDVQARGIVLKARNGVIATLSKDCYIRTGGADLGDGDILLDANRGKQKCQVYADEFNTYTTDAIRFNFGPIDESSEVIQAYLFNETRAILDVELLVRDKIINYGDDGDVLTKGGVYGLDNFVTDKKMAQKGGGVLGKTPPEFRGQLEKSFASAKKAADSLEPLAKQKHSSSIVNKFYPDKQPGHNETIELINFSFRDPISGDQYKVEGLKWPEARWQTLVRLGGATGGRNWNERPVVYQGADTYPYPGKKKLKDEQVFLELDELKLYDVAAGYSKDRPEPYEEATLGEFIPKTLDDEYKINR